MPTVVDTSVWIDLFRDDPTPQVLRLEQLIHSREVVLVGDLILAEILQGIRQSEVSQVEAAFAPFRIVPMVGEGMARQSAYYYHQLRSQGITVRKTIDCLIATWCIQNRVPLLHADRDFLPFIDLGLLEA